MSNRPSVVLIVAAGCLLAGARPLQSASHLRIAPPHEGGSAPEAGDLVLLPGTPQRREIAGGGIHHYSIALQPEEFVHILVDQQGISVALSLHAPDNTRLTDMDTPTGMWGPEKISWIATAAGSYRLEVRSSHEESPTGRYEVQVAELRKAEPRDLSRLQAETMYREGRRFETASVPEAFRKAIDLFVRCLPLFRELGDRRNEALILTSLGRAHLYLREGAKAEVYLREALPIWREVGDREDEGGVLFRLGGLRRSTGRMEEALAFYQEALFPARELGDKSGEAEVLTSIGGVHDSIGEKRKALENYRRALSIMKAVRNRTGELRVTAHIGALYEFQGEMQKALEQYRRALEICHGEGYRNAEPRYLADIGRVYVSLGETTRGIEYFERALSHYHALGDRWWEANLLVYIGQVHARDGEWSKAIERYDSALALYPPAGDPRGEATGLKALAQARAAMGQFEKASPLLQRALSLARSASDRYLEADVLTVLGAVQAASGDPETALTTLTQAMPLRRQVEDRPGLAATALEIARVERSLGNFEASRQTTESALGLLESLRAKAVSPDLRASFFGTVHRHYGFWIDLLMEMHGRDPSTGFDRLALEASERARARSLLDLLTEGSEGVTRGADPELLDRERSLAKRIAAKADRRVSLLQGSAEAPADPTEMESLRGQYEEVRARIRASSPRYAALMQPEPITVQELSQQLDTGSLLLEYWVGEERGFLWAVTRDLVKSFELPGRVQLETASRRVYELLTERNRQIEFETVEEKRSRVAKADADYLRAASTLSRLTLSPVAEMIAGKRLLVVSDGALQYVPFAALPDPLDSGAGATLGSRHEIISLPSASMLALLRRELAGRKAAPKTVAILADPVFDESDERLRGSAPRRKARLRSFGSGSKQSDRSRALAPGEAFPDDRRLIRAAGETGLSAGPAHPIPRLPFTRREARAVLSLVPADSRKVALGFDASLATAKSPDLARYRFIHFATHGFLNSQDPELSGVVLSLVDRKGRRQDGFLSAADVFNLELPAELVVLSGCRTGLGREIKGEGLVGLTRAFFYAGAARVLVSLWDVHDEATAVLMERFYREMLRNEASPAAALRAAQASVRGEKRWQAPYYWAGFILQGEPTGIVSRSSP